MFVGDDHILTKIEASDLEKKIIEGEKKIEKIITAINNPIINEKLKKEKIEVIGKDIQYKEGILEILENNKEINFILINENLPGEIKNDELINKIKK